MPEPVREPIRKILVHVPRYGETDHAEYGMELFEYIDYNEIQSTKSVLF